MVCKFAFPSVESDGMTFRQYAAVAAMQALIAKYEDINSGSVFKDVATWSCEYADALIKELEK